MKNILKVSSVFAIIAGVLLVVGGLWAICFTYQNVAQEKIITPDDASIPSTPVRGPLTLKSQSDIIREHTLKSTNGLTYAEMPRQIETIGDEGQSVMIPNTARDIWITSTTLRTALNLGIVTYVFSAFMILFGLISIWTGYVFRKLTKKFEVQ